MPDNNSNNQTKKNKEKKNKQTPHHNNKKKSKYCKKTTKKNEEEEENETYYCCLRQSLNRTNWTDSLFSLSFSSLLFFSLVLECFFFSVILVLHLYIHILLSFFPSLPPSLLLIWFDCFPLVSGKGRIQDYFDILD